MQRFVPDEQERVAASISRILNGERLTAEEFTVLRKDGTTFPMLVHANPVVHDDKVVGIRGVGMNITDRRRTEEALRKAHDNLERQVEERTAELKTLNEDLLRGIAERKRTEDNLQKLYAENKLILDSAWEGIFGIDRDGNHTFVNPSAARILGYEIETNRQKQPLDLASFKT